MLLLCYETDNNQADVIEAFNSTSRYLVDDLLYMETPYMYFEQMVSQIYPTELLLGWVLCLALFCCALLCVLSSFAITLKRKRELVVLL